MVERTAEAKSKLRNQISESIETLVGHEKFDENSFEKVDEVIQIIANGYKNGSISKSDITTINQLFGEEFLNETIQGFAVRKPYGYAGDFMIIDKIYTYDVSTDSKFQIWDKYFHQHSAPQAVRNRKEYFKQQLSKKLEGNHSLSLLNVASGPARDLFELYSGLKHHQNLSTTCVEMDSNAIAYAKKLNGYFLDRITFVEKNIFRYQSESKYDVIWSAGLFDYFEDKAFVMMLKRFREWLEPGGEIIIGNFNEDNNPSRDYMELFGEWYLHHRTIEQLIELAIKAGYCRNMISIGREEENVNLFLHIKR